MVKKVGGEKKGPIKKGGNWVPALLNPDELPINYACP